MSVSALLLRALLSLVLILNGSGSAMAATGMELGHLSGHAPAGETAMAHAEPEPPCHESGTSPMAHAGPVNPVATEAPPIAHGTPGGAAPEPDCCTASHCGGACLQHLTATVPVVSTGPVLVVRAASPRATAGAHAAPPLPNPIRPPIG